MVAMASWACARVILPEQTRPFSTFSKVSFVLDVEVAFGLSFGSTHKLEGSFGSPPSSRGIR